MCGDGVEKFYLLYTLYIIVSVLYINLGIAKNSIAQKSSVCRNIVFTHYGVYI